MWLWSFFLKELSVSGLLITETGSKGERSFTEQGGSGRILRPGSDNKESACQCRRPGLDPSVRKIPWRRSGLPAPVFLTGESHGQRSLVGYSSWGHKESDKIKPGTFLKFHSLLFFFSPPSLRRYLHALLVPPWELVPVFSSWPCMPWLMPWALFLGLDPVVQLFLPLYLTFTLFCSQSSPMCSSVTCFMKYMWFFIFVCLCRLFVK